MRITFNGEESVVEGTVADLVLDRCASSGGRGIAVAVNGLVITRSLWSTTVLAEGDRVDVVTAVQGG